MLSGFVLLEVFFFLELVIPLVPAWLKAVKMTQESSLRT